MAAKVIHFEVVGKDGEALQKFYGSVFGWEHRHQQPRWLWHGQAPENSIAGGIGATPDGSAGHVTFYVETDDPKATLAKVEQLGGKVIMPLTEIAPDTTVALFADPEGHVIGLM